MPFNLVLTSADGSRTFTSLRSPYPTRKDAQRTVYRVIAYTPNVEPSEEETEFVCRVTAAPLGETVVHEPSGISFCTEEVPS